MGEAILVLFGLALVGYLLVAPLVAFVFAVRASQRNEVLLERVRLLERRVIELSAQRFPGRLPEPAGRAPRTSTSELDPAEAAAADGVQLPAAADDAPQAAGASSALEQTASVPLQAAGALSALDQSTSAPQQAAGASSALDQAAPPLPQAASVRPLALDHAGTHLPQAASALPAMDQTASLPPQTASAPSALDQAAAAPQDAPAAPSPTSAAPAGMAPLPAAAARTPAVARASFEEQLGLTWLTRVGAAAFLLGALFFFKYAADNAWIGPLGRVAIGAATGAALLVAAEIIKARAKRRFVHAILGLGLATLFASAWASSVLYELAPLTAAFAASAVLLLLGAGLALRYRGEAILVLTLVAGFLNPVVLSTGQDRPLLLFSYLLLITSAVYAVSAKLGFRVAPWLALAGNAALFGGWYDRFFDASAPAATAPGAAFETAAGTYGAPAAPWSDTPAQAAVGPYLPLAARAVPLAFVALAAAQGAMSALFRHARAAAREGAARAASPPAGLGDAKALGVAALVLAHAGASSLLSDAPRALAAALIALAVAALAALSALRAGDGLLAPMGAGFLAFAATGADVPGPHRAQLAGLSAIWALIYIAGWLRGAGLTRPLDRKTAIECSAGAALFACVAAMLLLEDRAAHFALALAVTSAFVAWLAARAELPPLLLAAAIASSGALAAAAPSALAARAAEGAPQVPAGFLGTAALVLIVFLGAVFLGATGAGAVFLGAAGVGAAGVGAAGVGAAGVGAAGVGAAGVGAAGVGAAGVGAAGVSAAGVPSKRRLDTGAPALSWSAALAASVATLGFAAAALGATPNDTPTLRALLTGGAGAMSLALGATLLRRGAPAAPPADRIALLIGQALALFAAAVAFGLGGATTTVLWAILAAIAAAAAARTAERAWLTVAMLLFLAALVRALAVDLAATDAIVSTWLETRGREGAMAVPVLVNARAYAFVGVGAALLAAGRLLWRAPSAAPRARTDLRAAALVALCVGYTLLLATAILEVRSAITTLPAPPPVPLDEAEFTELVTQIEAAVHAQRGSLAMATTLVLAIAAIALLTAGFVARDAFHRYAGLALFVVTVAKLAAWDAWRVERIYQIALFTGVGALLVGGGFLYARFGRRLATILRAGPPGAAGLLAALLVVGSAQPAAAQAGAALSTEKHALVRPIEGVDREGDHRLRVDLDLYRQSLAGELLGDVRIAGPDGAEVPYLLREVGVALFSGRTSATMLDPGVDATGAAHATWALDAPGTRHCRVDLSVLGRTFLREVQVETGPKPGSLSEVARGAYVYRIRQGDEEIEHLTVTYPLSRAALVRIRLLPLGTAARGAAGEVRITGGTVSCEATAAAREVVELPLAIAEVQRDAEAKTTVVTLDAGADGVPIEALHLDVQTPEFSRRVDVASTTYRAVWPHVGGGRVYRIRPNGDAGVELSQARIPLHTTRKRFLRVTIHDADSAPLSITGARGEVRAREIVLRASHPGPHQLYVGDPSGERPSYDLEEILDRSDREPPPGAARLGAAQANPALGAPPPAHALPFTERHRAPIGILLAAGLLALSLWAQRLLRSGTPPGGAAPSSTPPREDAR